MLAVLSGFAAEVFPEDGQKLSQLRVNDTAELPLGLRVQRESRMPQ